MLWLKNNHKVYVLLYIQCCPEHQRIELHKSSHRDWECYTTSLESAQCIITLHNTTQHYTTVKYSTTHNITLYYNTAQHSTSQHNTIQHSTVQHSTTQYSTLQHNTKQYNTPQNNTAQHITAEYNTTQYNTAQYMRMCYSYYLCFPKILQWQQSVVVWGVQIVWCTTCEMCKGLSLKCTR